jgi:hypothetical protein
VGVRGCGAILRSKPIALEIEAEVPVPVGPRWGAKMSTIGLLQRHSGIASRVCGAVLQARIDAIGRPRPGKGLR